MNFDIRHSEPADAEAIKTIYADPSCYSETLQLPHPSTAKWQRFFAPPNDNFYSLIVTADQRVVGQLGMEVFTNSRRRHVGNIGMAVLPQWRRRGVASKLLESISDLAFNWLALRRLELEVYTDNKPACALYEKHGFVIEGTAYGYAFRDGEFADVHYMAKTHPA